MCPLHIFADSYVHALYSTLTSYLSKPYGNTTDNRSTLNPNLNHQWSNLMIIIFRVQVFVSKQHHFQDMKLQILHIPTMSLYACFLNLPNMSCKHPFASLWPPTSIHFMTSSRLLGLPPVLKLTTIKSWHSFITLHEHYRGHGFSLSLAIRLSINVFSSETNCLHITTMYY